MEKPLKIGDKEIKVAPWLTEEEEKRLGEDIKELLFKYPAGTPQSGILGMIGLAFNELSWDQLLIFFRLIHFSLQEAFGGQFPKDILDSFERARKQQQEDKDGEESFDA
jgi:hypothetical protein